MFNLERNRFLLSSVTQHALTDIFTNIFIAVHNLYPRKLPFTYDYFINVCLFFIKICLDGIPRLATSKLKLKVQAHFTFE